MASYHTRIDFDRFVRDPSPIFDQVRDQNEPIIVVRGGDTFRLTMEHESDIWNGYDPDKVREALKVSAGALHGVNREELLRDLHAQRAQSATRFY